MGIAFGTAVTIFRNSRIYDYKGTYNQIKICDIKNNKPKNFPVCENRFAQVSTDKFSQIPGSPVAYWVGENIRNLFQNDLLYEYSISDGQNVTSDNARFVRFSWEINNNKVGRGKNGDYMLKVVDIEMVWKSN